MTRLSNRKPAASVPAGSGERPLLDLVHLGRQTMGDRELQREVLVLFEQHTRSCLERLRTAADAREWHMAAHTLKGTALNLGAFALADLALEVERHGWSEEPDGRGEVVARLGVLITQTSARIAEALIRL